MNFEVIAEKALLGAFGGLAFGGSTYLKKKHEDGAKFEPKRLLSTCLAGAVIGAYAFAFLGETDDSNLLLYGAAMTMVSENLYKAIK